MSTATDLHRTITDLDHVRIFNLLRRQTAAGGAPEHARDLAELIDAAEQVRPQEIAPDVVTMLSKLRVADPATGAERSITLCYPPEADAAQGMISVLSPLGTSLLACAWVKWRAGAASTAKRLNLWCAPSSSNPRPAATTPPEAPRTGR